MLAVLVLVLSLVLSPILSPAEPGEFQNQIPSCYKANPKLQLLPPTPVAHLFVVIDETTLLDANLRNSLLETVRSTFKPGSAISVFRFSAFSHDHYTNIVMHGELEGPIPKGARGSISVRALETFDACIKGQFVFGVNTAVKAVETTLDRSTSSLQRSEIISSLAEISRVVQSSAAPKRLVLIVSDMIEHSSISSFYGSNNNLRQIDPAKELKAAEAHGPLGDFGGASIYVLGAGILPASSPGTSGGKLDTRYRESTSIEALRTFWTNYFIRSNGKLSEFGTPALLSPVKY